MKTELLLCAAVLVCHAAPASAAGLSLTWDLCATNAGAMSDVEFDCADPSGRRQLFGVFNSPSNAAMLALDFSIDLEIEAPALPDFWLIQTPITPSACNDGVVLQKARPASTICSAANPWGTGGGQASTNMGYGPGTGGPNRARLVGNVYRTTTFNVVANTNYYGFHLDFLMSPATEAGGTCAGCTKPTGFVWNSALIGEAVTSGAEPEDVNITGSGIISNCATVNGATGFCSCAVMCPTRNHTWGALKSLYR
jgi:hypothetical protein